MFGYKNYPLCIDDCYPFNVALYQGKAPREGHSSLDPKVRTGLLEIVDAPNFHHVYFDNFFTFPNLQLRE